MSETAKPPVPESQAQPTAEPPVSKKPGETPASPLSAPPETFLQATFKGSAEAGVTFVAETTKPAKTFLSCQPTEN